MRRPLLRFAATFFLLLVGFSVLSVVTGLQNQLGAVENGTATAAAGLARLGGSSATVVDGHFILVGQARVNINHECTGVFVLFVLASFIAAYPAKCQAKLLGIGAGVSLLSLINIVRIAMLVGVFERYPAAFEYFHEYVWQGAFLLLVTLYAISWVEWARR
jgi:exosortase/archaeosortase family protein